MGSIGGGWTVGPAVLRGLSKLHDTTVLRLYMIDLQNTAKCAKKYSSDWIVEYSEIKMGFKVTLRDGKAHPCL